jgi:hypothetical protein
MLTDVGPVEITVTRDRDESFDTSVTPGALDERAPYEPVSVLVRRSGMGCLPLTMRSR